jgi:Endopolygalacturonase
MNRRELLASAASVLVLPNSIAAPARSIGANMPWTTYPAEKMKTTGTVLGPAYGPFTIENEAMGQTCVKLTSPGDILEFTVTAPANTMLVRHALPDSPNGSGLEDRLAVLLNGERIADISLNSHHTWLYGEYPFTNNPSDGKPRHFFDDARIRGLTLKNGDVITLVKKGFAPFLFVDFVDLEYAPAAIKRPPQSLSIRDFGADGRGIHDDTEALRALLTAAAKQHKIAYVPPGDYKLTGDIDMPSHVTLQGAGMWHTTFTGDETLYNRPDRRLRFKLTGEKSCLSDFALQGKLKYRDDNEQNDGIFGAGGRDCTVARLWVEHTKVGMWFYLCRNIRIEDCRLRNTFADGINLCVDTRGCVIENCSARNTGDDCFAIWPAPSDQGFVQKSASPGNNVIRRCTGQLPFLAQGGAIYGGTGNRIEDCLFTDITSGCGILISTTFPTGDTSYDNNFGGLTKISNCRLVRCGGYDHGWTWRGALQICLHRKDISGLRVQNVQIEDSLSDGLSIITAAGGKGRRLTDAEFKNISITHSGIAASGRHNLFVADGVIGEATFIQPPLPDAVNSSANFQLSWR